MIFPILVITNFIFIDWYINKKTNSFKKTNQAGIYSLNKSFIRTP